MVSVLSIALSFMFVFVPRTNDNDDAKYTIASWYGPKFHGRTTANGEVFDQGALTCASNILKLGDVIAVTNEANGKSVTVTVNDRGPFKMDMHGRAVRPLMAHPSRGIDLSRAAFAKIANLDDGIIKVSYTLTNL